MQSLTLNFDAVGQAFPYLKDKMLIDFINGIEVVNALNNSQHRAANQGFIKRNLYLLSGKSQMTQNNINDHFKVGLQACHAYCNELAHHAHAHATAIVQLKDTLNHTQSHLGELTHFVADLKEQVDEMYHSLDDRVVKLELKDRASTQLENLLSAWQAERFSGLSPMAQCFLVLDTLKWGEYGFYINQLSDNEKQTALDTLKNKIIVIQKSLFNMSADKDIPKEIWLTASTHRNSNELAQALGFMGDYSWQNPDNFGMVFTATQYPSLLTDEQKNYAHLTRNMIDINRVSRRMMNDVFV